MGREMSDIADNIVPKFLSTTWKVEEKEKIVRNLHWIAFQWIMFFFPYEKINAAMATEISYQNPLVSCIWSIPSC